MEESVSANADKILTSFCILFSYIMINLFLLKLLICHHDKESAIGLDEEEVEVPV